MSTQETTVTLDDVRAMLDAASALEPEEREVVRVVIDVVDKSKSSVIMHLTTPVAGCANWPNRRACA